MDTMLTSLDQYLMTCDHLTDYIFNVWNPSARRFSSLILLTDLADAQFHHQRVHGATQFGYSDFFA